MFTDILFCKSQVVLNLSKDSKENRSGILVIAKDSQQGPQESVISWFDEKEISKDQVLNLLNIELILLKESGTKAKIKKDVVLQAMYSSWSFSVKLQDISSVQLIPPNPNGWFHGSLVIQSRRRDNEIPVLYFNDEACPSTQARNKVLVNSFQPFNSESDLYWGGVDFKESLGRLVDIKPTLVDPTVYLLNATADEVCSYSRYVKKVGSDGRNGADDVSAVAWNGLQEYSWTTMATIATATTKMTSLLGTLISKHPVFKLAERSRKHPYVRKLLRNPEVQAVQSDFECANIYLAKWSLGVKEQAEKYRKSVSNDAYRNALKYEFGKEDFEITTEELYTAIEQMNPITEDLWESLLDSKGRLCLSANEIKSRVFHGGIEGRALRKKIWPFLLGVFPWDSSLEERQEIEKNLRDKYESEYKSRCLNIEFLLAAEDADYWKDQIFRIEKDIKRTDRNIEFYKYNTPDGRAPRNNDGSIDSTSKDHLDDGDINDNKMHNPNFFAIKNILACFNLYNTRLGYVQGMSDLVSPLYFIFEDEAMSFWCFVNFMKRMERNFLRDQSGIRDQMLTLAQLCQLILPEFSAHLEKCNSSDFFFCFRMLLVWFKREFSFGDVCSIWEAFWTDFYSSQFQLFFMLAIFQKNSGPIVNHLIQFDEVLKYFNDLSCKLEWKDLMVRAELLFLHFRRAINIFQRTTPIHSLNESKTTGFQRKSGSSEEKEEASDEVVHNLSSLLSTKIVFKEEGERKPDSIK